MNTKLLAEHHLEFLSLKGGYTMLIAHVGTMFIAHVGTMLIANVGTMFIAHVGTMFIATKVLCSLP